MRDNSFINAIHLCLSGGKDFSTWLSLYTPRCLLDTLAKTIFNGTSMLTSQKE
ncbi:N1R/p28 gene family protein [Fowlpox virus]|uniref:N1R/p28 family protein n=1 Tax=Fowlpox virus TaxID=10261 RepID=A0A891LWD3_FOWPV|nr:N1R/p28 family protein [Fowlpox virus]UNS14381.1 ALPV-217 [Albatrosspox virus]WPD90871.1 hypothetical protein PPV_Vac110-(161-162)n2 [Avipoxvirus sp.]UQT20459.1 N1R/p28 family protein [Fowlpox virus]UQT20703.1 N1R/p28 family protein [Fowlpox virus]